MSASSASLAETAATTDHLTALPPGLALLYGGNRLARVPDEIAAAFRPGDHLVVVPTDGTVLHIPAAQHALVTAAVARAQAAFAALRTP
jgi:glutamate-5-semialdehyde dehydrogenase